MRHKLLMIALVLPMALAPPGPMPARGFDLGRFISEKLDALSARPAQGRPRRIAPMPAPATAATKAIYPAPVTPLAKPPRPRPRPARLAIRTPGSAFGKKAGGAKAPTPLVTARGGRLDVKLDALGRERNPMQAVKLAPKETGAWPKEAARKARARCAVVLAATNVDARPLPPIGGPSGCGIAAPVLVRSFGAVKITPPARLNCTFAAAVYKWLTDVVQPAARKRFHQPVVAIRQYSSYACRRRGGITRGPVRISEHAFGNALDVAVFTLADGGKISVLKDWGGLSALFDKRAAFLREVHKNACGIFSTVLGPEANKAHRNHFHFDLGRGGRYKYCH